MARPRTRVDPLDQAFIFCRWLHYGAVMLLFGTTAFQSVLSPAPLAKALSPKLRPSMIVAAAIALLTAVAWLFLLSGQLAGDWADACTPSTWYAVLADTDFGTVWAVHLAAAALLCCALAFSREGAGGHWHIEVLFAGLLLASLGLIGHAVLLEGVEGWLNRASQIIHLLAAGFWLGGLVPLLFSLNLLSHPATRTDASAALRRFSGTGHLAVALVLVTGIINSRLVLDRWPVHFSSPYQLLLAIKIVVVAIMVCLAIINRYALVPRLKNSHSALDALRAFTISEIVLGLIALALVSVFGALAPQ